uniref:Uncharacterized protein n=1 Tax=Avena sativa TaxID=4498 RepID=A0ACD5XQG0_AVESA
MELRHLGSGSGGSGGQSVDTSARPRRRMSTPSTGTRLMPAFNAVAGEGDGGSWGLSSSSSSGGLDLGLDESHPCYSRHRVYPEFSQRSSMGRLLFQGSPLGSRTTDDDVLVMDGVLVASDSGSGPRRYASFTDLGFVSAVSPRSGGSGRHSSSRQFAYGKEESRVQRAMNPRHSEVELQSRRSVQGAPGPNMQASPGSYHPLLPPWLQASGTSTPGAVTTPIRPPAAAYFTPPRATTATPARAPTGFSWTPKWPELKPPSVQRATFAWPPTEEENAAISQCLYGLRRAPSRRLPVFVSICPA